jgi:hypothetical protein
VIRYDELHRTRRQVDHSPAFHGSQAIGEAIWRRMFDGQVPRGPNRRRSLYAGAELARIAEAEKQLQSDMRDVVLAYLALTIEGHA